MLLEGKVLIKLSCLSSNSFSNSKLNYRFYALDKLW